MPDAKTIEAVANSSYAGLIFLLLAIGGVLYLLRNGYLSWSQGKVQVASDGASLAVLESMRTEIARLNTALSVERENCAKVIAQMQGRMDVMQARITDLEKRIDQKEDDHADVG